MDFYRNLKENPLWQAGVCVSVVFVFELVILLLNILKLDWVEIGDIWLVGTAMVLFYIILNTILGFGSKEMMNYYRDSIYGFLLILAFLIFTGRWLTGKSIFEVKTYSWIIFVFAIVYLVFLTIQSLMRKIVALALKQDKKIQNEQ